MTPITIVECGAEQLTYYPNFFSGPYFSRLLDEIQWQQNKIKFFGKEYDEPRLTAWYGAPYKYSGIIWPEKEMISLLKEIKTEIEVQLHFGFNSALINYYRDGSDSMGWHSDNEKGMNGRLIASASFGSSRMFKVRNKSSSENEQVLLEDGSLLLMHNFQTNWQHSVPKSKTHTTPRINITFRDILR